MNYKPSYLNNNLNKHLNKHLKQTLVIFWATALIGLAPAALATDFDGQINALNQQIKDNQSSANQKRSEADTLANRVAALNSEINAAQAALNKTRTEVLQTTAEIEVKTAELAHQTDNLRQNLQTMYKDRDVSPIEILASSENLSDFVGKQQYVQEVKDKIDSTITAIGNLKTELEAKKVSLSDRAEQEKAQVANIADKRATQQSLLAQTRGEEASYQTIVKQNQVQLASVYAARAEEIRRQAAAGGSYRAGGQCGGGYPNIWCKAAQDSMVDDYGYYNRECVSYVAWKRDSIGRSVPMFWGNAGAWYGRGGNFEPSFGDIVVWPYSSMSPYGHVAIVESNNGGSITVSEYNYGGPGVYSVRTIPDSALGGARFIR